MNLLKKVTPSFFSWHGGSVTYAEAALAHVPLANAAQETAITDFVNTCVADGTWSRLQDGGELWVCGIAAGQTGVGSSYSGIISGTINPSGVGSNTSQSALGWTVGVVEAATADEVVATGYTIPVDMQDDCVMGCYAQAHTKVGTGLHVLMGAYDTVNGAGITANTGDVTGQMRGFINSATVGDRISPTLAWASWPGAHLELQRRESTTMYAFVDGAPAATASVLKTSTLPPTEELYVGGWGIGLQLPADCTIGVAYVAKYNGATNWDESAFAAAAATLIAAIEAS